MTPGPTSAMTRESGQGFSEQPHSDDERSVGAILNDLWEKTQLIVRQEMKLGIAEAHEKITLIKNELEDKVERLKRDLIAKAIGGVVVFVGSLAIAAGIVLLLALWMPPWVAALLVGVALSLTGVVILKRGSRSSTPNTPAISAATASTYSTKRDFNAIRETSHDRAK